MRLESGGDAAGDLGQRCQLVCAALNVLLQLVAFGIIFDQDDRTTNGFRGLERVRIEVADERGPTPIGCDLANALDWLALLQDGLQIGFEEIQFRAIDEQILPQRIPRDPAIPLAHEVVDRQDTPR